MLSFMMTSADGYHADPGEALDWHNVDHEFSQFALAQLREAGTLVFGRVTYEGMAAFWPTPAGEQSDSDVAKAMNTTPKIVISRTLAQATWPGTQVISTDPEEELAKLKQQPGKDIVIAGSSTLTAGLLQTGLLDELRIMVNPVILGQGRSLFQGAARTGVEHLLLDRDDFHPVSSVRPGAPVTGTPAHHTPLMFRTARMSRNGSPSMSTRSARWPAAMAPRSDSPNCCAATVVADRTASAGEMPASTSNSSSWCRLVPYGGDAGADGAWLASVPARIVTPARYHCPTVDRATS